jgi:hypothetical protein
MKTIHLPNPRIPQLADVAGEFLSYCARWESSDILPEN